MSIQNKNTYNKPYLEIKDQMYLLKFRGLITLGYEEELYHDLIYIGYHYLSTYFKSFQHDNDNFYTGTNYDDIKNLYYFDQELKQIILEILNKIEIGLKNCISLYLGYIGLIDSINGNKFDGIIKYTDPNIYNSKFIFGLQSKFELTESEKLELNDSEKINRYFEEVINKPKIKNNQIILDFHKKYNNKFPPIRKLFEVFDFGDINTIYGGLSDDNKKEILNRYFKIIGVPFSKDEFELSINISRMIRNQISHCSRLRNISFKNTKISTNLFNFIQRYDKINNVIKKENIFSYIIIILILYKKVSKGESEIVTKITNLIDKYQDLLPLSSEKQNRLLYKNILSNIYNDIRI